MTAPTVRLRPRTVRSTPGSEVEHLVVDQVTVIETLAGHLGLDEVEHLRRQDTEIEDGRYGHREGGDADGIHMNARRLDVLSRAVGVDLLNRSLLTGFVPLQAARGIVVHGLNVLPTRKRSRQKPKRYDRPVPGDRVQMDTCKIRPGLYQFTAIDDCSRFLVASLARRRSAHATLRFRKWGAENTLP